MLKNRSRRELAKFIPLVLTGSFAYPLGKFLFYSNEENKKVSLPLQNIDNGITYIKSSEVFISKQEDKIVVFDAHCTHMGCILKYNLEQKQFNCPCHKSSFDFDGTRLKGPAKRDLDRVSIKVKNNTLYIG